MLEKRKGLRKPSNLKLRIEEAKSGTKAIGTYIGSMGLAEKSIESKFSRANKINKLIERRKRSK